MNKLAYRVFLNRVLGNYQRSYVRMSEISEGEFPYQVEVIAENLMVPWAIAISEDGKLYVTERSGSIRVIENGELRDQPLITFGAPFVRAGEGGLMGIALDPNFKQNHYIYVMHSYSAGNQIFNRVVRLLEKDNTATIDRVLIDKIPGGQTRNGGRIKIGPDQKLYITTGDAGIASLSQNPSSTAGKILRIELNGDIPKDNPIANSPVYSLGLRNPQGITWGNNDLIYATEHGQIAHDEINIIKPGANYGWPLSQGDQEAAGITVEKPLIESGNNTWAPSGITYVQQGPWQGKLLAASLLGKQLLMFTLDTEGTKVEKVDAWLPNEYGRLREVVSAEDGSIYLSTSNRDGRSAPELTDDRILRLIPK